MRQFPCSRCGEPSGAPEWDIGRGFHTTWALCDKCVADDAEKALKALPILQKLLTTPPEGRA